MARWGLTEPWLVARGPRATVWRVTRAGGGTAALKVAQDDDEAGAAGALRHWDGEGAVRCLDADGRAILLEWVDGSSLGDLARRGDLAAADRLLAGVAARLQARKGAGPGGLRRLDDWCAALTVFDAGQAPDAATQSTVRAAQALLSALLASAPADRPLHGDLHHDNVRLSDRGWIALDPKGLRGDPAFDAGNAFRNPLGCEEASLRPDRIAALADAFAAEAGFDRTRVLRWGAVSCALSIAWFIEDGGDPAADWRRLPVLLDAASA
jgi:streptomycin 6-kinase